MPTKPAVQEEGVFRTRSMGRVLQYAYLSTSTVLLYEAHGSSREAPAISACQRSRITNDPVLDRSTINSRREAATVLIRETGDSQEGTKIYRNELAFA